MASFPERAARAVRGAMDEALAARRAAEAAAQERAAGAAAAPRDAAQVASQQEYEATSPRRAQRVVEGNEVVGRKYRSPADIIREGRQRVADQIEQAILDSTSTTVGEVGRGGAFELGPLLDANGAIARAVSAPGGEQGLRMLAQQYGVPASSGGQQLLAGVVQAVVAKDVAAKRAAQSRVVPQNPEARFEGQPAPVGDGPGAIEPLTVTQDVLPGTPTTGQFTYGPKGERIPLSAEPILKTNPVTGEVVIGADGKPVPLTGPDGRRTYAVAKPGEKVFYPTRTYSEPLDATAPGLFGPQLRTEVDESTPLIQLIKSEPDGDGNRRVAEKMYLLPRPDGAYQVIPEIDDPSRPPQILTAAEVRMLGDEGWTNPSGQMPLRPQELLQPGVAESAARSFFENLRGMQAGSGNIGNLAQNIESIEAIRNLGRPEIEEAVMEVIGNGAGAEAGRKVYETVKAQVKAGDTAALRTEPFRTPEPERVYPENTLAARVAVARMGAALRDPAALPGAGRAAFDQTLADAVAGKGKVSILAPLSSVDVTKPSYFPLETPSLPQIQADGSPSLPAGRSDVRTDEIPRSATMAPDLSATGMAGYSGDQAAGAPAGIAQFGTVATAGGRPLSAAGSSEVATHLPGEARRTYASEVVAAPGSDAIDYSSLPVPAGPLNSNMPPLFVDNIFGDMDGVGSAAPARSIDQLLSASASPTDSFNFIASPGSWAEQAASRSPLADLLRPAGQAFSLDAGRTSAPASTAGESIIAGGSMDAPPISIAPGDATSGPKLRERLSPEARQALLDTAAARESAARAKPQVVSAPARPAGPDREQAVRRALETVSEVNALLSNIGSIRQDVNTGAVQMEIDGQKLSESTTTRLRNAMSALSDLRKLLDGNAPSGDLSISGSTQKAADAAQRLYDALGAEMDSISRAPAGPGNSGARRDALLQRLSDARRAAEGAMPTLMDLSAVTTPQREFRLRQALAASGSRAASLGELANTRKELEAAVKAANESHLEDLHAEQARILSELERLGADDTDGFRLIPEQVGTIPDNSPYHSPEDWGKPLYEYRPDPSNARRDAVGNVVYPAHIQELVDGLSRVSAAIRDGGRMGDPALGGLTSRQTQELASAAEEVRARYKAAEDTYASRARDASRAAGALEARAEPDDALVNQADMRAQALGDEVSSDAGAEPAANFEDLEAMRLNLDPKSRPASPDQLAAFFQAGVRGRRMAAAEGLPPAERAALLNRPAVAPLGAKKLDSRMDGERPSEEVFRRFSEQEKEVLDLEAKARASKKNYSEQARRYLDLQGEREMLSAQLGADRAAAGGRRGRGEAREAARRLRAANTAIEKLRAEWKPGLESLDELDAVGGNEALKAVKDDIAAARMARDAYDKAAATFSRSNSRYQPADPATLRNNLVQKIFDANGADESEDAMIRLFSSDTHTPSEAIDLIVEGSGGALTRQDVIYSVLRNSTAGGVQVRAAGPEGRASSSRLGEDYGSDALDVVNAEREAGAAASGMATFSPSDDYIRAAADDYIRAEAARIDERLASRTAPAAAQPAAPQAPSVRVGEYTAAERVGQFIRNFLRPADRPAVVDPQPGVFGASHPADAIRRELDTIGDISRASSDQLGAMKSKLMALRSQARSSGSPEVAGAVMGDIDSAIAAVDTRASELRPPRELVARRTKEPTPGEAPPPPDERPEPAPQSPRYSFESPEGLPSGIPGVHLDMASTRRLRQMLSGEIFDAASQAAAGVKPIGKPQVIVEEIEPRTVPAPVRKGDFWVAGEKPVRRARVTVRQKYSGGVEKAETVEGDLAQRGGGTGDGLATVAFDKDGVAKFYRPGDFGAATAPKDAKNARRMNVAAEDAALELTAGRSRTQPADEADEAGFRAVEEDDADPAEDVVRGGQSAAAQRVRKARATARAAQKDADAARDEARRARVEAVRARRGQKDSANGVGDAPPADPTGKPAEEVPGGMDGYEVSSRTADGTPVFREADAEATKKGKQEQQPSRIRRLAGRAAGRAGTATGLLAAGYGLSNWTGGPEEMAYGAPTGAPDPNMSPDGEEGDTINRSEDVLRRLGRARQYSYLTTQRMLPY